MEYIIKLYSSHSPVSHSRLTPDTSKFYSKRKLNYSTIGTEAPDLTKLDQYPDTEINVNLINNYYRNLEIHEQLMSKKSYILLKFLKDHPDTVIKDYAGMMMMVSNLKSLGSWYKDVSKEFSLLSETPDWLIRDPASFDRWNSQYQSLYVTFKNKRNSFASEKLEIEKSVAIQKETIDRKEQVFMDEFYKKHPVLLINRITTQSLPFKSVEPYASLSTPERKAGLKSELKKFKLQIFKDYVDGKTSIEALLEIIK